VFLHVPYLRVQNVCGDIYLHHTKTGGLPRLTTFQKTVTKSFR